MEKNESVELGPLLEEIIKKNNLLSVYCFNLLNKINDLYIRLEINSRVIEECVAKLGMSTEDYAIIVKSCVEDVQKVVEQSPLFSPEDPSEENEHQESEPEEVPHLEQA